MIRNRFAAVKSARTAGPGGGISPLPVSYHNVLEQGWVPKHREDHAREEFKVGAAFEPNAGARELSRRQDLTNVQDPDPGHEILLDPDSEHSDGRELPERQELRLSPLGNSRLRARGP